MLSQTRVAPSPNAFGKVLGPGENIVREQTFPHAPHLRTRHALLFHFHKNFYRARAPLKMTWINQ
eukprot:12127626-Prorocentrum_lima.AAC.1